MKKAEKAHLNRLSELGCIACRNMGFYGTPPEIHHPRVFAGVGQKASHYQAIPLCHHHHRTGGHGEAIHAGQKTWEARFGTEKELLEQVKALL